jgi:hypothetical protein
VGQIGIDGEVDADAAPYFSLRPLLSVEAGGGRAMSLIYVCAIVATFALCAIAAGLWILSEQLDAFTSESILYTPERQAPPPEVPPDKVESFVKIPESMLPRRRAKDETPL